MNTITYSKRFETFEDGLREITDLVPMVKEYMFTGDAAKFDSVLDDGIFKRDDLEGYIITNLIKKLQSNIPVASNPNYPYCYSIDVGSFNIGFKTDKRLSFGWKIHTERLTGNVYYIFRVTFPNSARKAKSEYAVLDNGWKEYEYRRNLKQNTGRRRFNKNDEDDKKEEVANDQTEQQQEEIQNQTEGENPEAHVEAPTEEAPQGETQPVTEEAAQN